IEDEKLTQLIRQHFDLRPYGILRMLDLQQPIYAPTAAYGHFGREDLDLPWERTDKADTLAEDAGIRAARATLERRITPVGSQSAGLFFATREQHYEQSS